MGLSTADFSGCKIVGDNKESIGLSGDGKIHFIDDSTDKGTTVTINEGCFKIVPGLVLGVGYIFKTR